jgi:8-oxo-dGTP pyrophosphatase MutT (NUDIX family)
MRQLMSCGFLLMRSEPTLSFLLMQHPDRWDLPKGHLDVGETTIQCALRELAEETGLAAADIEQQPGFEFQHQYLVPLRQQPDQQARKTLLVFLAWLRHPVPLQLTEHIGYRWFDWKPPHQIQSQTIDPLLAFAEPFIEAWQQRTGHL